MLRRPSFLPATLAVVGLVTLVSAATCDAQIVRFGPFGGVRVRAPFVSVDVGPDGSTRVSAPFTSVYSPGPNVYGPRVYRPRIVGIPPLPPIPPLGVAPVYPVPVPVYPAPVPVYPVPVVPAEPESVFNQGSASIPGHRVTRPSVDGHVAEDLRQAALRLQTSLARRTDGEVWIEYLAPDRIVQVIDQGQFPVPTRDLDALSDLVANYDGVVANRSLITIYSAGGFNETRELLRVYVEMQSGGSVVQQPIDPAVAAPENSIPQRSAPDAELLPAPNPEQGPTGTTPEPPTPNPPRSDPQPTDL